MLRTGDILGYARVSTADQDLSGQKDRLIQNGAVRVFEDVIGSIPTKVQKVPQELAASRLYQHAHL